MLLLALARGAFAQEVRDAGRAVAGECAPLPGSDAAAGATSSRLCAGVQPSAGTPPGGDEARGHIVKLPAAGSVRDVDSVPGEALLVLPKAPGGGTDTDFELAPDARVVDSYWSPVLCATVVRVAGPPDASPSGLVTKRPPGSRLSANKRYVPSATALRPQMTAQVTSPPARAGAAAAASPDPYLSLQYGLARTGALEGRPAFDGRGIRVAVLDSTPEIAHRELTRVRIVTLDGGEAPPAATHGTLVAGVIGADEDNAFGIAGVAPAADVIAIPICEPGASGIDECRLDALLRGLDVAWREDAKIANLSLVGPPDPLLEHAVGRMNELGILLVASAGNEATDAPRYPAAYPTVLGVGAFDGEGRPWARSNDGDWVRLLAPGVEILSTAPGNAFAFGDGTSLAAAHVSGMLALALMATDEPAAAARALLDSARAGKAGVSAAAAAVVPPGGGRVEIPRLCDVVARLGIACGTPARGTPTP